MSKISDIEEQRAYQRDNARRFRERQETTV